jgi:hypothetical protein
VAGLLQVDATQVYVGRERDQVLHHSMSDPCEKGAVFNSSAVSQNASHSRGRDEAIAMATGSSKEGAVVQRLSCLYIICY